MKTEDNIRTSLKKRFALEYINSAIGHFIEANRKYQEADWEGSTLKIGKFTESIVKALWIYCGQVLPPSRQFKVGNILDKLKNLNNHPDIIRVLIPRACTFIYDIASNRGVRHDPDEIDPNKMDASVVLPVAAWILAELTRFSNAGSSTPEQTLMLVEILMEKKYPYFEEIDGRIYVNLKGLKPREVGLLILNAIYPRRKSREDIEDLLRRHGYKKNPIAIALTRLKNLVDDEAGKWKLRGLGRQEAEKILSRLRKI